MLSCLPCVYILFSIANLSQLKFELADLDKLDRGRGGGGLMSLNSVLLCQVGQYWMLPCLPCINILFGIANLSLLKLELLFIPETLMQKEKKKKKKKKKSVELCQSIT